MIRVIRLIRVIRMIRVMTLPCSEVSKSFMVWKRSTGFLMRW